MIQDIEHEISRIAFSHQCVAVSNSRWGSIRCASFVLIWPSTGTGLQSVTAPLQKWKRRQIECGDSFVRIIQTGSQPTTLLKVAQLRELAGPYLEHGIGSSLSSSYDERQTCITLTSSVFINPDIYFPLFSIHRKCSRNWLNFLT